MTYRSERLDDKEKLARFASDKSHYRIADNSVKPRAFDPQRRISAEFQIIETSVSRVDGCSESEIWEMGDAAFVARQKLAIARSNIFVNQVRATGLMVVADEPPVRHAVISGWPSDDVEIETKMKELAAIATLTMRILP